MGRLSLSINLVFILQIFELESDRSNSTKMPEEHCYILQPVTGNARYTKLRMEQSKNMALPRQKASVNLEDVTLCLSEVHLHFMPLKYQDN